MKDIAKEAGVSIMTVSNVINGKTNFVSKDTQIRINKIIQKNHYVPNQSARALATNSSHIVGILVPRYDVVNDVLLSNPYLSFMFSCFEDYFRSRGYFVTFRSTECVNDEVRMLQAWNVDGIVLLHPYTDDDVNYIIGASDTPVVLLDHKAAYSGVLQVDSDDYQGAYTATGYLLKRGHRNIGFVGDELRPALRDRLKGYKDALAEHGIPYTPRYIYPFTLNMENGAIIGEKLATTDREITAVLSCSDYCSIGIMEGVRRHGLSIPEDLSIIGYDNISLCGYLNPRLTSVSQHCGRKAECAAEMLYNRMNGLPVEQEHIQLDTLLVERDSVADRT